MIKGSGDEVSFPHPWWPLAPLKATWGRHQADLNTRGRPGPARFIRCLLPMGAAGARDALSRSDVGSDSAGSPPGLAAPCFFTSAPSSSSSSSAASSRRVTPTAETSTELLFAQLPWPLGHADVTGRGGRLSAAVSLDSLSSIADLRSFASPRVPLWPGLPRIESVSRGRAPWLSPCERLALDAVRPSEQGGPVPPVALQSLVDADGLRVLLMGPPLAGGKFGRFRMARDASNAAVAVKEFRIKGAPEALGSASGAKVTRDEVCREAACLALVDSPARPLALYEDGATGRLYLVMAPGLLAVSELTPRGRPRPDLARSLLLEGSRSLRLGAAAGVVHLDIKPANAVLFDDGRVGLIDLGLARQLVPGEDLRHVGGSLAWMAPEVLSQAPTTVGLPADVWGLGLTVGEVAVGRRLFCRTDDRLEPGPGQQTLAKILAAMPRNAAGEVLPLALAEADLEPLGLLAAPGAKNVLAWIHDYVRADPQGAPYALGHMLCYHAAHRATMAAVYRTAAAWSSTPSLLAEAAARAEALAPMVATRRTSDILGEVGWRRPPVVRGG